jgi:hypothetical protein
MGWSKLLWVGRSFYGSVEVFMGRSKFLFIGIGDFMFTCLWALFARVKPAGTHRNAKFTTNVKGSSLRWSPSAIVLHGLKYFFSAWVRVRVMLRRRAPLYYLEVFSPCQRMKVDFFWLSLSPPLLVVAFSPLLWTMMEGTILARGSLLTSRRPLVFWGTRAAIHHVAYWRCCITPIGVMLFLIWVVLCVNSICGAAHASGFKSNYNELTVIYAGLLMGCSNTVATAATYVVPIGGNRPAPRTVIACLNVLGSTGILHIIDKP